MSFLLSKTRPKGAKYQITTMWLKQVHILVKGQKIKPNKKSGLRINTGHHMSWVCFINFQLVCVYSVTCTLCNKSHFFALLQIKGTELHFAAAAKEEEAMNTNSLFLFLPFLSKSCCIHHCYQCSLTGLLCAQPLIWQLGDCYKFPFYPVLVSPFGCSLLIIMIFSATLEGSIMIAGRKM